jgi:hypothetical protein
MTGARRGSSQALPGRSAPSTTSGGSAKSPTRFHEDTQKSFLCAPERTASQTCTGQHIRAFYDKKTVL